MIPQSTGISGTCSCSLVLAVVISAILILCMKEREATQTKKRQKGSTKERLVMIFMKKIVLALAFVLLGSFMLSGCSQKMKFSIIIIVSFTAEFHRAYRKVILEGTKEKGIYDYTGTYTADYENFSQIQSICSMNFHKERSR